MLKHVVIIIVTLLIGILSGCQSQSQDSAEIEQVQQQLAAIESQLDQLNQGVDVSDLEARLDALETQNEGQAEDTNHEAGTNDQVFQVTIAAYLLDTAGFHDLDERINEEDTILPGDAGTMKRVNRTVAVTAWPDDLQVEAAQLRSVLEQYAEALSDDDVEAAKPLAGEAHDVQHNFSQAIEKWLAGEAGHEATEHTHEQAEAHSDHSAHQGGLVGMSGDLHLEIVSEKVGEYQVFISDAFREPIDPEGVSGILVLNPSKNNEMELPLQVMHGEHLMASGGPTDVDLMDVSIRLDGTPEGHVEIDFTISYDGEHEEGGENEEEHEHDEDDKDEEDHDDDEEHEHKEENSG